MKDRRERRPTTYAQWGLRNGQVACRLSNAVGGKFAYIFLCVEVHTSLAHGSFTIEYSQRIGASRSFRRSIMSRHMTSSPWCQDKEIALELIVR